MKKPSSKNHSLIINPATFISLFVATFFILLYYSEPLTYKPFLLQNLLKKNIQNNKPGLVVKDELQIALEKASMANKTLIIATVNRAYAEPHGDEYPTLLDLFLEGFWAGEGTRPLVSHLLVVAMDRVAYERCEFRGLNCYMLAAADGRDGFAGEKVYMTDGFIEMMWTRTRFLLDVLKRGFSFIFTDTDVLWLRNPFKILSKNETLDLQISIDFIKHNSPLPRLPINTGFYFVRSNTRTLSLFQTWYESRVNSNGLKEQDVLEDLMKDGVLDKYNLNTRFLNTVYFSGFCEDSQEVELVATVHANCCRGIRAKVEDLKAVLKAWKRFRRNQSKGIWNGQFHWPKHRSCEYSWEDGTKTHGSYNASR